MAATTAPPAVGTTTSQGLTDWAAPYITGYLGKAATLGEQPYSAYQGPLTAGPSTLQSNVFSGLGSLSMPTTLGQSFSSTGAYQPPNTSMGGGVQPIGTGGLTNGNNAGGTFTSAPSGPTGVAGQYMNPYLQSVLDPQLAELRRQNDITNMGANAKLTGAGAFGGSRQAVMNAENNRNLMQEMNKTVGTGYANAYDKAMNQFNTEQGRGMDLTKLMTDVGGQQRAIESEGVAADLAEFNQQRQYPYQQLQFQRDMISGLPTSTIATTQNAPTGIAALASAAGGLDKLLTLTGSNAGLAGLLKNLGLDFTTPA
jgi:hypothetical protein